MSLSLPIALDAMGGDKAPASVIQGAQIALRENPSLRFIFFGDEQQVASLLAKHPTLAAASDVVHTDEVIEMHDKVSSALRSKRRSSMRLAIDAVANKTACAVVSSGNTGALMATAKYVFKTLPGIARPAITAFMPSQKGEVVMLDMGANVDCTSEHLVQFATMGDAYARAVLGLAKPRVALLNVGSEDLKGHDVVQGAHQLIREAHLPIDYIGFVEGHDILEGAADVVVTDGFTGNVALKTAEGAARFIFSTLKASVEKSWLAKIGYLLAKPALKKAMGKLDPRARNGAILLGLNGLAVKSHGGTDAKGFAHAIGVAVKLVEQDINNKIIEELTQTGITAALTMPTLAAATKPAAIVSESVN